MLPCYHRRKMVTYGGGVLEHLVRGGGEGRPLRLGQRELAQAVGGALGQALPDSAGQVLHALVRIGRCRGEVDGGGGAALGGIRRGSVFGQEAVDRLLGQNERRLKDTIDIALDAALNDVRHLRHDGGARLLDGRNNPLVDDAAASLENAVSGFANDGQARLEGVEARARERVDVGEARAVGLQDRRQRLELREDARLEGRLEGVEHLVALLGALVGDSRRLDRGRHDRQAGKTKVKNSI